MSTPDALAPTALHPVAVVSLGTAGVVVGHEAEAVHRRRQLLKLLPAEHPRLPGAAQTWREPGGDIVSAALENRIAHEWSVGCCGGGVHLVTAGGMTRMQSSRLAFSISHTCFTRWTSSLCWVGRSEMGFTRVMIS